MASGRRPEVASVWKIRSVTLRTRDGPERLEQAYRRLLAPAPPDTQPACANMPSTEPMPDRVHAARR
jgi:hypothetical protein